VPDPHRRGGAAAATRRLPYAEAVSRFPVPGTSEVVVAVPAPRPEFGHWAGSPSAAQDDDGTFAVAYRTRGGTAPEDPAATVIARSQDGGRLETVATLEKSRFGAMSMERPALVRADGGRWWLFVCCATPGSKHWWIDLLEAEEPEGFADVDTRTVFPGDEVTAVKDPIVQRVEGGWQAWICCHPLDEPDQEDRMWSAHATSADGIEWKWHGNVLMPRPGKWDARGARLTAVLPDRRAAYDGRATKEENWFERTGLARGTRDCGFEQLGDEPVSDARYLDVLPLRGGGYRIYYEWPLPDGSHELRTELIS
jgi:hypothetical protein